MIKILKADLSNSIHANALVKLLNRYALGKMGGGEALSEFTQNNVVKELKKRTDTTVILAFDNDVPIGLLNCIEGFSTFACKPLLNIHDVFVIREYRGKGIATRLLEEAEKVARESDCCKVTLEVLEGNEPARSAYLKYGFSAYELDPEMGQALFWEKKLT